MEFFTSGIDLLQKLIMLIGGGTSLVGIFQFMMAQKDHDAGGKSTAINVMMSGVGVFLIGTVLVPMLKNLIS